MGRALKAKLKDPNNIVNGRWKITHRLGFGSFGDIYQADDKQTGKALAAKVEPADSKYPQLSLEYKVYKCMSKYNGFPRVYWQGECNLAVAEKPSNVMIMDKLGLSLEQLYIACDRKFDVKTVCMIGIQLVNRIQSLHKEGYIHRDIKPDNFLIGVGDKDEKDGSVIHMIDMGLVKQYRIHGGHIAYKDGKRLTGTPRYASINTHNGIEQSRRDDVESLCYLLIYFLKGSLPWQGLKGLTKNEKYEHIRRKKLNTAPEVLCSGLPEELCSFFKYVRKIEFSSEPDYRFLKKLLQLCCQRQGYKIDWRFTWQTPITVAEPGLKGDSTILQKPKKQPSRRTGYTSTEKIKIKRGTQSGPEKVGKDHKRQRISFESKYDKEKSRKRTKLSFEETYDNRKRRPDYDSSQNGHDYLAKKRKIERTEQEQDGMAAHRSSRKRKNEDSFPPRNYANRSKPPTRTLNTWNAAELLEAYQSVELERDTYKKRCLEYEMVNKKLMEELNKYKNGIH